MATAVAGRPAIVTLVVVVYVVSALWGLLNVVSGAYLVGNMGVAGIAPLATLVGAILASKALLSVGALIGAYFLWNGVNRARFGLMGLELVSIGFMGPELVSIGFMGFVLVGIGQGFLAMLSIAGVADPSIFQYPGVLSFWLSRLLFHLALLFALGHPVTRGYCVQPVSPANAAPDRRSLCGPAG